MIDPCLMGTALIAGLVYGFTGFGAALIFMPVALLVVDPVVAVAGFALAGLGAMATVVPQAWPQADKRAALTMLAAAVALEPVGVWVLRTTDPTALRWAVSAVVLGTLAALLSGWRYRQSPGLPAWLGVGAGVGFLGGSVGLNGPVLVLFQLGGPDAAARTRANAIVVLSLSTLALLPIMALQGVITRETVLLGLVLLPIYALGAYLGRRLFNPGRAGLYRGTAYLLIGAAGIMGLPIWG
ncbi:sulfite exporter TauE/SafE family protein [Salibaculum halophilum]|uniref:sulfite exporter TauE/SafE family protein n=1 Tax=Salibaculum halophilum TaxID=1914408 RepID=UPI001FECAB23|nr:sulfite exporter TauE/SafE family protein [Salibaculum halophilum]